MRKKIVLLLLMLGILLQPIAGMPASLSSLPAGTGAAAYDAPGSAQDGVTGGLGSAPLAPAGFTSIASTLSPPALSAPPLSASAVFPRVDGSAQMKDLKAKSEAASGAVLLSPPAAANSGASAAPAVSVGPRSSIEERFNAESVVVDEVAGAPQGVMEKKNLEQYGYRFFDDAAGRFIPATDAPVGPDYVLGPGDRVSVTIWGSFDGTYESDVNRSGEINIPRAGAIKVWGVAYRDLERLVRTSLARSIKDFRLSVNVGKLRTIKVFVVGEVRNPGVYDVSSVATALNALVAAGGPAKTGSLRKIAIKRGEETVGVFDMYDFFSRGARSQDVRLFPGDTIVVPVIGRTVAISGNVKRPAIYEIADDTTLADVFAMAGGLFNTAYVQKVQVSRVVPFKERIANTLTLDPHDVTGSAAKVRLCDLDAIIVSPIKMNLKNSVRLAGYVARPGEFVLRPGMGVADLIGGAENLLPEYNKEFAEVTRFDATGSNPRKFYINTKRALDHDPAHNVQLQENDIVRVFSRWEKEEMPKVRISGEVQAPGQYRLYKDMTVRDLVLVAGNLKKSAYLKNLEITRLVYRGDEVKSVSINIDLGLAMSGDTKNNVTLDQDDELLVRMKPNWADETERYVQLKGEFKFPGVYPIYRGETLASVVRRAGGYTDKAYLPAAKFTRRAVQSEQQARIGEVVARSRALYESQQAELIAKAGSKEELDAARASLDVLRANIDRLDKAKAEGRVVVALKPGGDNSTDTGAVEMLGGDVLEVPMTPNSVHVMGAVYNQVSSLYQPGRCVRDYIERAGGMTKDADESELYLIGADGSVKSSRQTSFFRSFMSTEILPGDAIVVPQRLETTAWMRNVKDITTIISQVAVTAGVIIAAGL